MFSEALLALCVTVVPTQGAVTVLEPGTAIASIAPTAPRLLVGDAFTDPSIWRANEPQLTQANTSQAHDDQDVVFFAADSVEFQVPHGWSMQETPYQRDVFLQLSPGDEFTGNPNDLRGGVWMRYRPFRGASAHRDLTAEFESRFRSAIGNASLSGGPRSFEISGNPGMLQEFFLPTPEGGTTPAAHAIVMTQWGVFELQGIEANFESQFVSQATGEILRSLKFHAPAPAIGARKPPIPAALAAAPIFGSWKAINGRVQVLHDGRVALEFDRKQTVRFDESGTPRFRPPHT
ncbi:MAG: hypothetical protein MPJ50_13300, partial [Pirellulales bacterium]|nr:hypothetical protein [Pirellulales bacterium]